MTKKEYKDFKKSRTQELDLFSNLGGIFDTQKDKYSSTVELYDLVPKYYYAEQEELRKKEGFLKAFKKSFIYKKQLMEVEITPAQLFINETETKFFYPSFREEIIEDVLRKMSIDKKRNELLDDMMSVRFTLYELWKELKKIKHTYSYGQIIESLEILSKTSIKIKEEGKNGRIELSSNMFETFGAVNINNKNTNSEITNEKSKKIIYYVRFNALVTKSIQNETWRLINYEQCMAYRQIVSRYLHKRISHLFLTGNLQIPYNIMLSTIIRDSGITDYNDIRFNLRRIKSALEEMIKVGSISKYEFEKQFFAERKNKITDVRILIYISNSFFDDIQKGFLKNNLLKNENGQQILNKTELKEHKTETNLKQSTQIILEQQIKDILLSIDSTIKFAEITKIFNIKKTTDQLILNLNSAKQYINILKDKNKNYNTIAIIKQAIKEDWQPNKEQEDDDSNYTITSFEFNNINYFKNLTLERLNDFKTIILEQYNFYKECEEKKCDNITKEIIKEKEIKQFKTKSKTNKTQLTPKLFFFQYWNKISIIKGYNTKKEILEKWIKENIK
ncbi:MAG: hypothetical protein Ta2D_07270 [Rickettsiales bacterium]|nr:MAG: hypothetical protein Ta2D_07270 [Rickettsiales bacterium]